MKKKELASILSEILVAIGFKKKGNYWVVNGAEITKMINLQKSQFRQLLQNRTYCILRQMQHRLRVNTQNNYQQNNYAQRKIYIFWRFHCVGRICRSFAVKYFPHSAETVNRHQYNAEQRDNRSPYMITEQTVEH